VITRLVPYLPLNPLLPRLKGDEDAEGMKKQISAIFSEIRREVALCQLFGDTEARF